MKATIAKSNEYGLPLSVAIIDYDKAFDTIKHWAIYLLSESVEKQKLCTLNKKNTIDGTRIKRVE